MREHVKNLHLHSNVHLMLLFWWFIGVFFVAVANMHLKLLQSHGGFFLLVTILIFPYYS